MLRDCQSGINLKDREIIMHIILVKKKFFIPLSNFKFQEWNNGKVSFKKSKYELIIIVVVCKDDELT